MKRIEVALGTRSYEVTIGEGALAALPEAVRGRAFVVTDANVWAAQGHRLAGMASDPVVVAPGEGSKSWETLAGVCDQLLARGIGREDTVVAFGGGMVGDLAGFAAAIVKRGCRSIQVPTTLLAQVDSSVGGKTAINAAGGKNMIGAFHQPAAVLIDPATLETLPARELRAGYAEVVKYGLIGDPAFFAWCEEHARALIAGDVAARLHAIETSVAAKAAIVGEDERERTGRRALLNLGHTFAHAIEAETGFRVLHGEAVALGMVMAFRLSARRGLCSSTAAERVKAHIAGAGLPTSIALDPARMVAWMAGDKKAAGGKVPFILARGIGAAFVDHSVALPEVEAFLASELG
jgi:3-dehydroquinate synthase